MGFIPHNDPELRAWLQEFASAIGRDPLALGLSSDDASTMARLAAAFSAASNNVANPFRRTCGALADLNQAREQAVAAAQRIAAHVKSNPAISMDAKFALGIIRAMATQQSR